jgi:hypothetical protein
MERGAEFRERSALQMMTGRSALWIVVAGTLLCCGCGQTPREQTSKPVAEKSVGGAAGVRELPRGSGALDETAAKELPVLAPVVAADKQVEMTVVMEDCKAKRPGKITASTGGLLSLLFSGPPKDRLVKRGTISVDGQEYTLYLPKADSYSTTNSGTDDSDSENTSTLISIDQNGDGKLTDDESWFANLPVRLGDTMFDLAKIAGDGSQIILRPSKSPLRGVVIGRTCPPFSFVTADGEEVSLEKMAGKAFILDIWSYT